MGQILSREDDDEYVDQEDKDKPHSSDETTVRAAEEKEKPKRRQRPAASGLRSRKTKPAAHGRTKRIRATPVTFDVRDYY
jgi:hypothetical protein